jgi:hypothetical protein
MGTLQGNGAGASVPPSSRIPEIRAYLQQLLASPAFSSSSRRSKLLAYLCNETLSGKGAAITEYGLALDVFGKPSSFDPRLESTVRSEVTRLRQKLKEHYQGPGRSDAIVIELPLRSYTPAFTFRSPAGISPPPPRISPPPPAPARRWTPTLAALAACVLLAVMVFFFIRPGMPDPPPLSLAVLPVDIDPSASDLRSAADQISQALNNSVLLTQGISGRDWPDVAKYRGPGSWREARRQLSAALFLETRMDRRQGVTRATLTLRRRSDGSVAWSGTFPIRLDNIQQLNRVIDDLAAATIRPVLQREIDYLASLRFGTVAIAPPLAGLQDPGNPCSRRPSRISEFFAPNAQVDLNQDTHGARSYETRIPFQIGAASYPSQNRIVVKARMPLPLRAPSLIQLAEDTCILNWSTGIPVYRNSCVVPPAGQSHLDLHYTCTPKAYPIDISHLVNDGSLWNAELAPRGASQFQNVPFLMPAGPKRFWRGSVASDNGARPVSLTIPVNRASVSTAYFLLNTEWGQPGPQNYLALEFNGDHLARFEKKLVGGVDVRDYHNGTWLNTINETTTRSVFDNGRGERIDLVEVPLPAEFQGRTLESITLRDTGRPNFERAILWAVTVR